MASFPTLQALAANAVIKKYPTRENYDDLVGSYVGERISEAKEMAEERAKRPYKEAIKVIQAAISDTGWATGVDHPAKSIQIECYRDDSTEAEVIELNEKVEEIIRRATTYRLTSYHIVRQDWNGLFSIWRHNRGFDRGEMTRLGRKEIEDLNQATSKPDYLKYLKEVL
jgi:hypothetical protein